MKSNDNLKNDSAMPTIDGARMKAVFDGINGFGRNEVTGGFNRTGFSDADMEARHWLAGFMEREGLTVRWDTAGNLFGRLEGPDSACVMAGSHTDTVPEGGAFDGTLGVVVALEAALAIRDAGLPLAHPIEVVDTAEEEGRFGGMLGSQAMAGLVSPEWLERATDPEGRRLWEAMEAQGFEPARIGSAARPPGSVKAFLELHVEQGPVLLDAGMPVGIADCVSGIVSLVATLTGAANHSGTTPMHLRADAFAGLARIAAAIPDLIAAHGTDQSRVTVGKVELQPNFPHTIPGRAEFSVILRDTNETVLEALVSAFRETMGREAARGGLALSVAEKSRIAPVALDPGLVGLLGEEAKTAGVDAMVMPSGAGHDAQTMQSLCPSGLLFVPSRGGVSHAPDEHTEWDHAVAGARVMLAAMTRLVVAAR